MLNRNGIIGGPRIKSPKPKKKIFKNVEPPEEDRPTEINIDDVEEEELDQVVVNIEELDKINDFVFTDYSVIKKEENEEKVKEEKPKKKRKYRRNKKSKSTVTSEQE